MSGSMLDRATEQGDRLLAAARAHAHDAERVGRPRRRRRARGSARSGGPLPPMSPRRRSRSPRRRSASMWSGTSVSTRSYARAASSKRCSLTWISASESQGWANFGFSLAICWSDARRLVQSAREAQVVAEHDRVLGRELAVLLEAPQLRDGQRVPAGGRVGDRARPAGHQQPRVLGEDAVQVADRHVGLDARGRHPAVEARQQADAVLRVPPRAALRPGRGGCRRRSRARASRSAASGSAAAAAAAVAVAREGGLELALISATRAPPRPRGRALARRPLRGRRARPRRVDQLEARAVRQASSGAQPNSSSA